jgi:hypothetical protein
METYFNYEIFQNDIPVLGVGQMPSGLQSEYNELECPFILLILPIGETFKFYVFFPTKDTGLEREILIKNIKQILYRYKMFKLERKNVPLIVTVDCQNRNPTQTTTHTDRLIFLPLHNFYYIEIYDFISDKLLPRDKIKKKSDALSDYVIIDYIGNYISAHFIPNSKGFVNNGIKFFPSAFQHTMSNKKMFRTQINSSANNISAFMINNTLGEHCTPNICTTDSCSEEIKSCREKGNKILSLINEQIMCNGINESNERKMRRYEFKFLNNIVIDSEGNIDANLLNEISQYSTLVELTQEELDEVDLEMIEIEKIVVPESVDLGDFLENSDMLKLQVGGNDYFNGNLSSPYYNKYIKYKKKYITLANKIKKSQ